MVTVRAGNGFGIKESINIIKTTRDKNLLFLSNGVSVSRGLG